MVFKKVFDKGLKPLYKDLGNVLDEGRVSKKSKAKTKTQKFSKEVFAMEVLGKKRKKGVLTGKLF